MVALVNRRKALLGVAASAAAVPFASSPLAAGQPIIHIVQIERFEFSPQIIHVKLGDVIRWTNNDLAPHTATADKLGWDTGELAKGTSAQVTVSQAMETTYFCAFHPHMKGAIEIT